MPVRLQLKIGHAGKADSQSLLAESLNIPLRFSFGDRTADKRRPLTSNTISTFFVEGQRKIVSSTFCLKAEWAAADSQMRYRRFSCTFALVLCQLFPPPQIQDSQIINLSIFLCPSCSHFFFPHPPLCSLLSSARRCGGFSSWQGPTSSSLLNE